MCVQYIYVPVLLYSQNDDKMFTFTYLIDDIKVNDFHMHAWWSVVGMLGPGQMDGCMYIHIRQCSSECFLCNTMTGTTKVVYIGE